jgi:TP53 regulating kinase-like protein
VLKAYEDNPENYIALEDALNTEVYSYKELSQLGIPIPQLLGVNHHKHLLLKEYIPGETVMESLGKGPLALEMLQQALNLSARAREGGFNLDWFPANFVWYGGQLIYIDYEVQPWMQEWSLEEWGIWYWLNPEGFAEFLKTKDGDTINYPGTPKPYREGIIAQRYLEFFGSKLK